MLDKTDPPKVDKPRIRVKIRPHNIPQAKWDATLAWSRQSTKPKSNTVNPYTVDWSSLHPKGVLPTGHKMAFDQGSPIQGNVAWAAAAMQSIFDEGLTFLGYSYLSYLAQRPEYRRISEIIAQEMTRKWIKLQSVSDDDKEKNEKIKELVDELDRLQVRDHFQKIAEYDGYMGRAHLYIDTGATDDRAELKLPIGDGRNATSKAKIKKKSIKGFRPVEAVWCYPTNYDSVDPLKGTWYEPDTWFVMGKEIHSTRLLKFVGRPVPDLLKPAYSFGGLSLSQMAKPYVDNWLETRQAVNQLIQAFSVFVLSTDLGETVMQGGQFLFNRIAAFNQFRTNSGLMVLDKDTEEFQNVNASLGTLDELQAQSQEHICSVTGIPLVKYTGISPHGLNASSEGEIRVFYDSIHAFQEKFFRPNLTRVIDFVQLSLWGKIDEDIVYKFEPLWAMDDAQLADLRSKEADVDEKYVNMGVLSQLEVRKKVAAEADSPYAGLDVDDVPDLKEEELAGGLEPQGGRPNPAAGGLEPGEHEAEEEPGEGEEFTEGGGE